MTEPRWDLPYGPPSAEYKLRWEDRSEDGKYLARCWRRPSDGDVFLCATRLMTVEIDDSKEQGGSGPSGAHNPDEAGSTPAPATTLREGICQ